MNSWVVAALIVNAVLVAAAIVVAVHVASRSVTVAVRIEIGRSPPEVSALRADESWRMPLFSAAQMTRTEWHALLAAFDRARLVHVRELVKARTARASIDGSLSRATRDFEVAKRRLARFELEVTGGASYGRR